MVYLKCGLNKNMTDYTIISKVRNKKEVDYLVDEIRK